MSPLPFLVLAEASRDVAATSSRTAKTSRIAAVLRACPAEDVPVAVAYLSGELRQRRPGVGVAALRAMPAAADDPSLGAAEVDEAFERMSALAGAGSTAARMTMFRDLAGRCTLEEQRFLAGLVSGELRQGALESLVLDAVAQASGVSAAELRQAVTLAGASSPVAVAVLSDGPAGLSRFRLTIGQPLRPMLAQSAQSVAEALERVGEAAVDWKLDGVRIQVHRDGSDVRAFTRTLDDVTDRVPDVVEQVLALPARRLVLDGELIALRPDGRPQPFQVTASRTATRGDVARARADVPLTPWFFDVLHLDGADLIGEAGASRTQALSSAVPSGMRVPRLVTGDAAAASTFLREALGRGHEGVVVKSLEAPYLAGRRGAGWVKVKPRHTLDLVVLAVEWGHGRRQGWLSNLHLGARDPASGQFVMLGKTFKGLTDSMLAWQTEKLLSLAVDSGSWVVTVRPELVVEVAFDGVQTSPRYPAGMALRFARVVRHRPDKSAAEADSIETVREIWQLTG